MPKLRRKHIQAERDGTVYLDNGRGAESQFFIVKPEDVNLLIDELQKIRAWTLRREETE